jgi:hypothetical protein
MYLARATFAFLVCVATLASGCARGDHQSQGSSSSLSTASSSSAESPTAAARLSPPPVPERAAYLGAWINPTRQQSADSESKTAFTNLGILHVYARWDASAPIPTLKSIRSAGAVPLLDWACGPADRIVNGKEDDLIRAYAHALKDFGEPVFLRYAWEMNLDPQRPECASGAGPGGFVAAWNRVRRIFRDVGAANVSFVWCPGVSKPDAWNSYFPGVDAVDWIGIDGYVRDPDPGAAATAFAAVFGSFYERFADKGKPIMVAETGALPGAQAAYLGSLSTVLPKQFPHVKAFVYFDAAGPRGDWSLQPEGLRALAALSAHPYFSFHA